MNIKLFLTTIALLLMGTVAACQIPPPAIDTAAPMGESTVSPVGTALTPATSGLVSIDDRTIRVEFANSTTRRIDYVFC